MSFAVVGAVVAVAGVGAGIYGTISAADQAEQNRQAANQQSREQIEFQREALAQAARGTVSYPEFNPETAQLFRNIELPFLRGSLGEQEALARPFLGGFPGGLDAAAQYGGLAPLIQAAGQRGAESAGVTNLGAIEQATAGLTPDILAALNNLILQRGAGIQTIMAPGFASFFAPRQVTKPNEGPVSTQTYTDYVPTPTDVTSIPVDEPIDVVPYYDDTPTGD